MAKYSPLTRANPPPSINRLQTLSKSTRSCDETILVKLSYSKVNKALLILIHSQDESKWNAICTNGIVTIDLATYGTYECICVYDPKLSSHQKYSVSNIHVHTGRVVYSQLAMSSRIRMQLAQETNELTPKRVSSVNIHHSFPALDPNLYWQKYQ